MYDRVFLDTKVLIAATDPHRGEHSGATVILNQWTNNGTKLFLSGQIVREYLVVATRPLELNGLGLDISAALHNVRSFFDRAQFLAETDQVAMELLRLLERIPCIGKPIHDANVVATMLAYGLHRLVTANVQDFARFSGLLEVVDLAMVAV